MKAILCQELGEPERLQLADLPSPIPEAGQIRIGVKACGINFADTLIIQGLYQEKPALPFTPGSEVAGIVLEIGDDVDHNIQVGDRVAALCTIGGMAEEVVVAADAAIAIPPEMDFATAASFTVAYGTAHVALECRAKLQAGETLLVHGASGGVGIAAVEIGKAMGATVIATASTEAKLAVAQSHGADHLINYSQGEFRNKVKELTNGAGVDVIFDPVGGEVFEQSLRCINWEGRLLVIGFASGAIPKAPANILLVKNISVVGIYWGAYRKHNPNVITDSLAQLYQWYVDGELNPHISEQFPLENAAGALRSLIDRHATGKVVVVNR